MGGTINERISATERDAWDHETRISHLERTQQTQSTIIDLLIINASMANKLIAMNMFAIVRIELATCVDSVINDALVVKRVHTGSNLAKTVAQCATALAVMAGNVVSAGGLAAIGQIVVGASTALNGAIQNDPSACVKGGMAISGGTIDLKFTEHANGQPEFQVNQKQATGTNATTTNQNKAQEQFGEMALTIFNAVHTAAIETADSGFNPKRHAVFFDRFAKHGAGGTSAITYDVTLHVTNAYKKMINDIEEEIKNSGPSLQINTSSPILQSLTQEGQFKQQHSNSFHPLTIYVLSLALGTLINSGTEYKNLSGRSGHWFKDTLPLAQSAVTRYYQVIKAQIEGTTPSIHNSKTNLERIANPNFNVQETRKNIMLQELTSKTLRI